MSKFEETTIGGQRYKLLKLSPLEGGRMATLVGRQLAAALDGDAIKGLMESYAKRQESAGTEQPEDTSKIGLLIQNVDMVTALAGGIGKVDADALYDHALACIRGNLFADHKLHDDTAINMWFDERPQQLLPVLAWALKVNCSGFFGLGGKA